LLAREQKEVDTEQIPINKNKFTANISELLSKYSQWKEQIDGLTILENEYESIIEGDRQKMIDLKAIASKLENELKVSETRLKEMARKLNEEIENTKERESTM
jgi:chromosome segregation ATPase